MDRIRELLHMETPHRKDLPMILVLGTLLAVTPLRFITFACIIYVIARLLPIRFGLIGKLLSGYLIFVCVDCFIAAGAWLLGIQLPSGLLLCCFSIPLLVYTGLLAARGKLQISPAKLWDINDFVALSVVILTAVIFIIPTGLRPNAVKLAPVIMAGGDNSTHLQIIKTDDFNRGYSIGTGNRFNMAPNMYAYPQGWHFNGAVIKWVTEGVAPLGSAPSRILAFFYAYTILWFGLLVFLMIRLSLQIQTLLAKRRRAQWAKLATVAVTIIGIAGWILPLHASGFQAQIGSLTLLLLEAAFLAEAYYRKPTERWGNLLLAGLAMAGINFMWVFLAPVAMLPLLVCLLQTLRANKSWKMPWPFIAATTLIIAGAIFQVVIQMQHPESGGGIDAYGYVPFTTMYPLIGIMVGLGAYLLVRKTSLQFRVVALFTTVALLFALGIMWYQMSAYHEVRYYYFKSTYTFILFGVVLISAAAGELFERVLELKSHWRHIPPALQTGALILCLLVVSSMIFIAHKSIQFDDYYHKRQQGITTDQANAITGLLSQDPINGLRYVPIGSCDRGQDIRAVLLANALAYTPKAYTDPAVVVELTTLDKRLIFWQVGLFIHRHHKELYVVSRDQSLGNQLMASLNSEDRAYVRLIDIDPDPPATLVADCPDRLGKQQPTTPFIPPRIRRAQ